MTYVRKYADMLVDVPPAERWAASLERRAARIAEGTGRPIEEVMLGCRQHLEARGRGEREYLELLEQQKRSRGDA
jgi:hypothetical protein